MKIALASDHGGFELKEIVKKHLLERNIEVIDLGTNSTESVDYPAYGTLCGETVVAGKADAGIVVCGTGIGISIAANKVKGVRCGLCTSVEMILAEEPQSQSLPLKLLTSGLIQSLKVEDISAELICLTHYNV